MGILAVRLSEAKSFIQNHGVTTLRAAFFLASFMVILEHFGVLEGIDALMLRVLPDAFMRVPSKSSPGMDTRKPIKVLVFTIQQELFETEFKSSIPIDRSVLRSYLEELVKVFPSFKVLAIDYDLSPNSYNNDARQDSLQKELEKFLLNPLKLTKNKDGENDKDHHGQKKHVVLIHHIPVENLDLCEKKVEWEKQRHQEGILFGHSDLLHFGALGPVVKYADSQDNFPAIVFAAANDTRLPSMESNCDYLEPPDHHTHNKSSHSQPIKPINFLQAVNTDSVKICALHDRRSFKQCKDHFGEWANDVKVIFFGGHYGRDDIYMTPLGLKPGVTVHANIYFSMMKPLKPIVHAMAWGIDIILGFITGLIFHKIWQSFHSCRKSHEAGSFVRQVKLIVLNFAFLLGIIAILMFLMNLMLGRGLWMNPAPMLIGLFIHSYMTTAISATIDNHTSQDNHTSHSFGHQLFGLPEHSMTGGDFFLYGLLKIAIFWTTLGIAIGILLTPH